MSDLSHVIRTWSGRSQFWGEKQLLFYYSGGSFFAELLMKIILLRLSGPYSIYFYVIRWWPTCKFHRLVILPYILNTAGWICLILGIIAQCGTDHMIPAVQCDPYFTVQWPFMHQIHYSFIDNVLFWKLRFPATTLIVCLLLIHFYRKRSV